MSISTLLEQLNDFLLEQCGTTNKLVDHVLSKKSEPIKSLFFIPYESKSDFGYRAASIITAPIGMSFFTLKFAATSLYLGARSIADLARLDPHSAKIHVIDALVYLAITMVSAILTFASPLINLVDLIGSGISTLKQRNEEPIEMQPSFN